MRGVLKQILVRDLKVTDVVFLDLSIGEKKIGRLYLGLFGEAVPKTVENFKTLISRDNMGYKNTNIHRIIEDFVIQGGDITNGDGTGGVSGIDGSPTFEDENFDVPHFKHCVAMANKGPDTNGSQFYITLRSDLHVLDGEYVVFGRVMEDSEIFVEHELETIPTDRNAKPIFPLSISDCGTIDVQEYEKMLQPAVSNEPEKKKKKKKLRVVSDEEYLERVPMNYFNSLGMGVDDQSPFRRAPVEEKTKTKPDEAYLSVLRRVEDRKKVAEEIANEDRAAAEQKEDVQNQQ